MEKAKGVLEVRKEEEERVSNLCIEPHRAGEEPSFYESFAIKGITVQEIKPGYVSCTFTVPPRLTDSSGKLSNGGIANLIDELGGVAVQADGRPLKVSVDMSISYLSPAKAYDEVEIVSRILGHKGGYSGTEVILKNRRTGEIIAQGRHSLFGRLKAKI
ncbi:hypothetical protein AMTRI_Chr08g160110 [Amborella trichopoda]